MKFDSLRTDIRYWGWARSLFIRVMSRLQRHTGLRICRVNVRPLVRRAPEPNSPRDITPRVVTPEELQRAAADPELDLDPDFVRDALARGDIAFGAFEGDRLVGYTWRTFTCAPHVDGLWVKVDRPYQYSYKAYTRRSHRRRRIHVAVTSLADSCVLDRGYVAEVGFVDIGNFSGLALADFMGRRRIGYAGHMKWFGRRISFRTPAVKKIGVGLFERNPKGGSMQESDGARRLEAEHRGGL